MAAVFPTSYFLAIGTAVSNLGVLTELSGGSYARLACGFTGNAISGLTQTTTAWVVATAPTPAVPMIYGAIFDGLTGGNMIAYWNWNAPYTTSLTAMPIQTINITFNTYISTALNLALLGGQGTSGSMLDAGAQLGTANGNPLLAGCRLNINPGGTLAAHLGQGQWTGSLDVQGSLFASYVASGNINTGVTALAGGASSASTPVLTGFFNRITVCATSLDSVMLPGPTLQAGTPGSLLLLVNSGATIANLIADSPATVNGLASLSVGIGNASLFFRESSTRWLSIPKTPS